MVCECYEESRDVNELMVLILVLMEDGLRDRVESSKQLTIVLILVLMEDGLRVQTWFGIMEIF